MFKISPIQTQEEQILVAKACGAEYRIGAFGYAMRDSETNDLMGFSQFEINSNGGFLWDLRPSGELDDYEAMFILGRATMNFIDLCGAHTLSATSESGDTALLRAIGLKPTEDGNFFCDMTGFFDGSHCSGH
jgi:hypothetical protein